MPRRIPRRAEQLEEFLRRVMKEKDITSSYIAARAKRYGFNITREYVRQILNQSAKNLTIGKLEALAAGIDEPLETVLFAAAGIDPQAAAESFKDSVLYKLYLKSQDEHAPPEERELIAEIASMVAEHLRKKGMA